MTNESISQTSCPLPITDYPELVLAHGGGGSLTHRLIQQMIVPAFDNPMLSALHDGATITVGDKRLAVSTDSYVVRPWQFPGGDIGKLAIHGTVNDLAMCGAIPQYLSMALILEEGFPMPDLWTVILSMKAAADACKVTLITGDTKVVDKGCGDGIFINTTGIGIIGNNVDVHPTRLRAGDRILLSGDIGRHGMAVMAAREALIFDPPIESDTAALHGPVQALIAAGIDVHCLRDPTRGGLATTLVEIAESANLGIRIDESSIPVTDSVRGAAEILGLDPLYVANEGRFIAIVDPADEQIALDSLRAQPLCATACCIGSVTAADAGTVTLSTLIGGERALDRLSGEQLPRIC